MEQVTLDSLANSIGQLTQIVQSIVQHLENNASSPSKVFKVFGSESNTLTQQGSTSSNPLLLCFIEKVKTDLSIAKKRRKNSLVLNTVLGLELPIWVHVPFRPTASMGLDDIELAIAAYLYGDLLVDKNDAGVWVASWMIACFEDDHFNIKVDDGNRMKIAVLLVSKNHNMIAYRPKPLKNLNGSICQICGETVGLTDSGDVFVACNEYEYVDEVDDLENEFSYGQGKAKARPQWDEDADISSSSRREQPIPLLTHRHQ
ncbi:hypothetical protein S245_062415, partial [Arachis hypogaea]